MNDLETKRAIEDALKAFSTAALAPAAIALFESLGYKSQKRFPLKPNTPENFVATFAKEKPLNPEHALLADWQSVDFLFQLTDDEVRAAAQGDQQFLFESKGKWNGAAIESYLFFAITLAKPHYTRTDLSNITRAVNRLFPMPAMILFRHGDALTLAVINRRLHKRDESRDVLEKVTLIKDIRFASPHRAHVEILADLSFDALRERHDFANFVALHAAWQKALDSSELNKRFFQEVANWYFWALDHAEFPKDAPKQNDKDHISVIRLITRLMFCWFVKEKGLIPDTLFDERKLAQSLKGFAPQGGSPRPSDGRGGRGEGSVFYKAILQNLFFATLNTEMDKRGWTKEEQNFMAHSLYRHRELFQNPNDALGLFNNIPFLNGGLFECLDKDLGENVKPRYVRIDGFSRREDCQPVVPDFLFFGAERDVDLSESYGDKKFKKVKVRGLIHTFDHYKFTVAENTPIEEEIALDPELSGKVFENLLAAYNPETGATARKQTGSFYTPREIVNYMVDEALIACLGTKVAQASSPASSGGVSPPGPTPGETPGQLAGGTPALQAKLRHLFAYNDQPHQLTAPEVDTLIAAIDSLKSLDPAVGSGAFPMGILHKLVFILGKLDPRNEKWKERQISRVRDAMAAAEKIDDATVRERAVRELEQQITGIDEAFEHNELDYGRKLYLIENCIYGVDIQPIAVQIAKMRFFISLIVDQKIDDTQPNRGVRPLPNLETKFVAANTLIGVNRPGQQLLRNREIDAKEASLREVRRRHFLARSLNQKRKCREHDEQLRAEIAELLKDDGWDKDTATKLASWNPYDQNAVADFFDAEWMFSNTDGFDLLIGNPPYISHDKLSHKHALKAAFTTYEPFADIYCYFFEKSLRLLLCDGVLSFITSNSYIKADYGLPLRKYLCEGNTILQLLNIEGSQVFESAIVNVAILLIQRAKCKPEAFALVTNAPCTTVDFPEYVHTSSFKIDNASFGGPFWSLAPQQVLLIKRKIEKAGVTLERLQAKIRLGIATGANEAFIIDEGQRKLLLQKNKRNGQLIKPILRGRDIERYSYTHKGFYLLLTKNGINVEHDYPDIYAHLDSFGPEFKQRGAKGENWYNLRACAFFDDFAKEKIIWIELTDHGRFALCSDGIYLINSAYFLLPPNGINTKFLLALLNSRLIKFYLGLIAETSGMGTTRWINNYVKEFPIATASPERERAILSLVSRILEAKEHHTGADTSTLELEIDQQVYALYALTPEEINIVEDASK